MSASSVLAYPIHYCNGALRQSQRRLLTKPISNSHYRAEGVEECPPIYFRPGLRAFRQSVAMSATDSRLRVQLPLSFQSSKQYLEFWSVPNSPLQPKDYRLCRRGVPLFPGASLWRFRAVGLPPEASAIQSSPLRFCASALTKNTEVDITLKVVAPFLSAINR